MEVICDKCGANGLNKTNYSLEFIEYNCSDLPTGERTTLCQSCYQSFIVYFDNFMEEKSMKELPFGYKMDDEVCKLLVYWREGYDKKLDLDGLIYNLDRPSRLDWNWRLTGKGGKLYRAIIDNLKHQYIYGDK